MNPRTWLLAAAAAIAVAAPRHLAAQEGPQDPPGQPAFLRVRFVGHADGLPRPGVVVLESAPNPTATVDPASGFVVAEDERVLRLRRARATWRSDPAGEVLLPTPGLRGFQLFAAEPFSLGDKAPQPAADGVLEWQVWEREPVGVRAIDGNGKPLARFPVALHTGGRDVAVALTDDDGRALLGMPEDHTARIWLAPAGWLGSMAVMPTIARGLAGRRGTDLVVPPHGSVRVQALRSGRPAKVELGSISVQAADRHEWAMSCFPRGGPVGFGFELPFVAVGAKLTGNVSLGGPGRFEASGPARAGDVATVPVDVAQHLRPKFTIAGPSPASVQARLHLRFVTDAGTKEAFATLDPNGVGLLSGSILLAGKVLERIDFDAFAPADATTAPRSWTASLRLCRDIPDGELDLGVVKLEAGPTLHGCVIDADGKPLAGIEVVAGTADHRQSYLLRTDDHGCFAWSSPLPRDATGALKPLSARARTPSLVSATVAANDDGSPLTLRLVEPAPPSKPPGRRAAGTLVATVEVPPIAAGELQWGLRGDHGWSATPQVTRNADGTITLRFAKLQAGRYALVLQDRTYTTRLVCTDLEVPDDGACSDARLRKLSIRGQPAVTTVRVVDHQGVPIAGVRATLPGGILTSDGHGRIRVASHETTTTMRVSFEGNGLRSRELAEVKDGQDVVMSPNTTFRVHVTGLPADVPAERLEIWVRHEQRERFLGPRGDVDAKGDVELETPVPGRYFVNLLVKVRATPTERYTTLVAIRATPVDIGDGDVPAIEWQLSDEEVARLRERAR